MKYVTITEVKNGWVVEIDPSAFSGVAVHNPNTHVFRDIKELQEKLPEILGVKPKDNPMYEAFQKMCPICAGTGGIPNGLDESQFPYKCSSCNGTGRYSEPIPEGPKNL